MHPGHGPRACSLEVAPPRAVVDAVVHVVAEVHAEGSEFRVLGLGFWVLGLGGLEALAALGV